MAQKKPGNNRKFYKQLWRNWHTRMIQVHVSITLVWVQVPPTARRSFADIALRGFFAVTENFFIHSKAAAKAASGNSANKNPAKRDSAPQTRHFQATVSTAFACASLRRAARIFVSPSAPLQHFPISHGTAKQIQGAADGNIYPVLSQLFYIFQILKTAHAAGISDGNPAEFPQHG